MVRVVKNTDCVFESVFSKHKAREAKAVITLSYLKDNMKVFTCNVVQNTFMTEMFPFLCCPIWTLLSGAYLKCG